ncbi:uncharacterized protein LOC144755781 [Lissotriton helveticus]
MEGRGNPPLSLYLLLLLLCGTGTAGQDTSTIVPASNTKPVSGQVPSRESTSSFPTGRPSENVVTSTVLETTSQKYVNETLGVTASLTRGNTQNKDTLSTTEPASNYTHTVKIEPPTAVQHTSDMAGRINSTAASTVLETSQKDVNGTLGVTASLTRGNTQNKDTLSTKEPTSNYTHTVGKEPTTAVQHTSDMVGRLNSTAAVNNNNSETTQPATQHTPDMSEHPITTLQNNSLSASTQSTIEHTSDRFNRTTTEPITANQSSKTESTLQYKPTTTPLPINHTSGTESTAVSLHPTTHSSSAFVSSSSSANVTTPPSVNNTEHTSSIAVTNRTTQVSSISINGNTTDLPTSTTNTNFTHIPLMSSSTETVTKQTESTENIANSTVHPTMLTNATLPSATVQNSTSAGVVTSSSVSGTTSTLGAQTGVLSTLSTNETTGERNWSTTRYVSLGPTLSTSTVDYINSSKISTSAAGVAEATTTTGSNYCRNVQCPPFSYCVPGISSYSCVTVKIVPGELHLKTLIYTPDMANQQSFAFLNVSTGIEKSCENILKNKNGYIASTVTKLTEGSVIAAIENIFQHSTDVTSTDIKKAFQTYIDQCVDCWPLSKADSYSEQDLCSINMCDASTTVCQSKNGTFSCNCKEGLFKPFPSERSCTACTSGYKLENNTCVKCPFGYAGFNCDDSSLLAVVVISCVLGSVLLILLISLLIACNRSKAVPKESYEHETYLMWPKKDVPKIPRVTMNLDSAQLDYGSKNVLVDNEMSNGTTVNPEDSRMEADLKTFSNTNPSRYSYLCHGQTNPYFVDEEK